jgi:hypothetical protein
MYFFFLSPSSDSSVANSEAHWTRHGAFWLHAFTLRGLPALRNEWYGAHAGAEGGAWPIGCRARISGCIYSKHDGRIFLKKMAD